LIELLKAFELTEFVEACTENINNIFINHLKEQIQKSENQHILTYTLRCFQKYLKMLISDVFGVLQT